MVLDSRAVSWVGFQTTALHGLHPLQLKVFLQAGPSDSIVAFSGNMAVSVHDVYRRKISAANDPVYDAFGDLQFASDLLHGHPFRGGQLAGVLQHVEEPLHVSKEILADRAGVGICCQLLIQVVRKLSVHRRIPAATNQASCVVSIAYHVGDQNDRRWTYLSLISQAPGDSEQKTRHRIRK